MPSQGPLLLNPSHVRGTGAAAALRHPLFSGLPVRIAAAKRPDDDEAATAQTIVLMSAYAAEDSRHPWIRAAALDATGQATDQRAQLAAIHRWIRGRVRFVEDSELSRPFSSTPDADEVLVRPADLLAMPRPAGDCDDFSMLTAAMLLTLGIRPEYVTIAADPKAPHLYTHVYVVAHLADGTAVAMDTSHGSAPGWQAPAAGKYRAWKIPMNTQGTAPRALAQLGALAEGDTGINWGELLRIGAQAGSQIATARFAVPPTGTYVATPQGTLYRQQPGQSALQFPNPVGSSSWIWIAGGMVALFLFASLAKNR